MEDTLSVPGQTSPVVWAVLDGHSGFGSVDSGVSLRDTGALRRLEDGVYTNQSNKWIHSDSWNVVDASLYEARFAPSSGGTNVLGSAIDTWISIDNQPEWYVYAEGGSFDFDQSQAVGVIEVREIAVPANIVSGDLTLRATWEGIN
jgi:hypothetical protein